MHPIRRFHICVTYLNTKSPVKLRFVLLVLTLGFLAIDLILFNNCTPTSLSTRPDILPKGEQVLGVEGMALLAVPTFGGLTHRFGLGSRIEAGYHLHFQHISGHDEFLGSELFPIPGGDMGGAVADIKWRPSPNGLTWQAGLGFFEFETHFDQPLFESYAGFIWGDKSLHGAVRAFSLYQKKWTGMLSIPISTTHSFGKHVDLDVGLQFDLTPKNPILFFYPKQTLELTWRFGS